MNASTVLQKLKKVSIKSTAVRNFNLDKTIWLNMRRPALRMKTLNLSLREQSQNIIRTAQSFTDSETLPDDVTLVGVRILS